MDSSWPDVLVALQPLRRYFKNPAKDEGAEKSDREQDHDAAWQPIGRAEHRDSTVLATWMSSHAPTR